MKPRILIVNGALNELASASSALRQADYEVILAAGAQQALAAVSGKIPDLILVDLSGPDTRRLRTHGAAQTRSETA